MYRQFPLKCYCRRVGTAEGSCANEHKMRPEELQRTLKLKKQEMKFKYTQPGKGQAESCDPYQRQHKGQKGKKERSRLKP